MSYSLKTVFKGAITYSGAKMLVKACGFLLIPLYTRYLTPEDYGILGYLDVVFLMISTFLFFGFNGSQTRLYYDVKQDGEELGAFLFSLNIFLIILLLISCTVLTLLGPFIYNIFASTDVPYYPFYPLKIWTILFQGLNQMAVFFYIAAKQYKKSAAIQILQYFLITATVIFLIVYFNLGAIGRVMGTLLGQFVCFLFVYPLYVRKFKIQFRPEFVKAAIEYGFPIMVYALTGVVFVYIDRVILLKYVSIEELGIYTLGYTIGMLMSVLVVSVNRSWSPNYYDLMSSDSIDKKFQIRKAFGIWMFFMGAIYIVGSMWSVELIRLMAHSKFQAADRIVPIILLSYFFQGMYFFFVQPIFFFKKTKLLPLIMASAAIINIFLNFLIIPKYGIIGAATTTLVCYLYLTCLSYFIGKRFFSPGYNLFKTSLLLAILFLVCGVSVLDYHPINKQFLFLLFFGGYMIICYLLFEDYLGNIILFLKNSILKSKGALP